MSDLQKHSVDINKKVNQSYFSRILEKFSTKSQLHDLKLDFTEKINMTLKNIDSLST